MKYCWNWLLVIVRWLHPFLPFHHLTQLAVFIYGWGIFSRECIWNSTLRCHVNHPLLASDKVLYSLLFLLAKLKCNNLVRPEIAYLQLVTLIGFLVCLETVYWQSLGLSHFYSWLFSSGIFSFFQISYSEGDFIFSLGRRPSLALGKVIPPRIALSPGKISSAPRACTSDSVPLPIQKCVTVKILCTEFPV